MALFVGSGSLSATEIHGCTFGLVVPRVWDDDGAMVDVTAGGLVALAGRRVSASRVRAGSAQVTGDDVRLVDVWVTGGVVVSGVRVRASGVRVGGTVDASGGDLMWMGGTVGSVDLSGDGAHVAGVTVSGTVRVDADGCTVTDNVVHPADDAVGIAVAGDSNTIMGNRVVGSGGDHAVEVESGTGNVMVGNVAAGTFAGAPYADSGTSTQTTWPGAAAPQGDNLIA